MPTCDLNDPKTDQKEERTGNNTGGIKTLPRRKARGFKKESFFFFFGKAVLLTPHIEVRKGQKVSSPTNIKACSHVYPKNTEIQFWIFFF